MPLRGRTLGGWGGACDKSRTSHRECVDFAEIANYNKRQIQQKKPHSEEHGYNRGLRGENAYRNL